MAEKALKRKPRPQAAPPAGDVARRPQASQAARDLQGRQGERDMGAHYAAGPAYGLARAAVPPHEAGQAHAPAEAHLRGAASGEPLPASLRRRYEAALGHDLGGVRLHRGIAAERATGDLQARAFTYRNHIWLGPNADPADTRLMAHELTHVVQQGHAPALPHRVALGLPTRAANSPQGPSSGQGAGSATTTGGSGVQRWSLMGGLRRLGGSVVSGVRAVGRGIASVGRGLLNLGRDALLALVRRISPEFARLFERDGIGGFLRDLIARGFRALFGGVIARVRRIFGFGSIGERFRSLGSAFVAIVGQLARNDCSGITRAAERFGSFMSRIFEPIATRIRSMADAVSGFFRDVWNAVGAPVMRFLREIGGAIWQSIRGFISSVGRVISRVKNALGRAWSRVKSWLGIEAEEGTGEGGGLWNWIKGKAAALWNRIKGPLQPILGPLRVVGGVLLVLSPVGPILLVIRAWPHLRQAFQWVRERWHDLNLVVRARRLFANTVLPAVRDGATRVGEFLVNAADWLLGLLGRVSSGIQSVTGRLSGGILAPLGRVVDLIAGNFRRMVEWARSGLRWAAGNARSLFRRLIEFIQPIIDVLRRIIAIAVNPFGIPGLLMGTLWRIIPDCLKGPIINFILGILIRVIRAIPGMFALGVLWPFIRAAVLGFLERVRSFTTQRKVDVSNKIARIISGMSPSFAFGYLRGIFLGLWDGIAGPFIAIRQLFELPGMIRDFLNALGLRICDLVRVIRCFAATITERAIGAFDALLEAARDLLQNPGRILELIRCAIEAALSAVAGIGASVADQMMRLFEGPEDALGERLGRLTGGFLVDAVLAFFTAGASTATTVIRQVAGFLRTIGRNLMRIVRMVARLIPRFLGFIRKIGGMFRRAGSRAGGLLRRIGSFFRRVAAWFRRMMRRIGRRFRRRGGARRRSGPRRARGRRGRRRRDRRQWRRFRRAVNRALQPYRREGIERNRVRSLFSNMLYRFRRIARASLRPVRKDAPFWRLYARRRDRVLASRVARVLLDRSTRRREGNRAIRRALRRLWARTRAISVSDVQRSIRPFWRRFRYDRLGVEFDRRNNEFDVFGEMSPRFTIRKKKAPRPARRLIHYGGSQVTADPLFGWRSGSSPSVSPPLWNDVRPIRTVRGRTSLYIRGHLLVARGGGGSGSNPLNLTPITRSANARMWWRMERIVQRLLLTRHVLRYVVRANPSARTSPPKRWVCQSGYWRHIRIPAEGRLASSLTLELTKKRYDPDAEAWVPSNEAVGPINIRNVPPFPPSLPSPKGSC